MQLIVNDTIVPLFRQGDFFGGINAGTGYVVLLSVLLVVLGTRRTDRSATDSASPVDIVGSAELAIQPAADMLEVVRNVVPSFNVQQNQISDASTFVRAPSLRG